MDEFMKMFKVVQEMEMSKRAEFCSSQWKYIGNKKKKKLHFDVLKLFDVQLHVSMTDI